LFYLQWILGICGISLAIDKTPTGFYYPTSKAKFEITGHGWFGARDIDGYRPMGVWHCGLDISGKLNDPVYAIADGEVVKISRSGWSDSEQNPANFGYLICHTLKNGEKFVAIYGHLRRPAAIREGSRVSAGQEIGHLGPWSYGIHLHFGVYQDRKNPTSGNYPSSGHGRQPNPRPKAEVVNGVNAYGNWFDPIVFIEKRGSLQVPLRVLRTYPKDGATNISPKIEPAIKFNQPLAPETIKRAISISPAGTVGEHIPYELPGKGPPKLVLAEPDKVKYIGFYFNPGMTFTIKVNQELESQSGVPLSKPFEFRFTISSAYPSDPRDLDVITDKSFGKEETPIKTRVSVSAYTFREEKYGQPFSDVDWDNLSREPCSVFRPEERIFIHYTIQGLDPAHSHKVVIAYHLPGQIVGRPEKWAVNPEEGLVEIRIPAGRKKWWGDTYFREGFFFAQPGPRLIQIYVDGNIRIDRQRKIVDFYSKPNKEIIVQRKGELRF
jgi:murein DD-endopeptidase MepM/ murein hydrolase activator NlpD